VVILGTYVFKRGEVTSIEAQYCVIPVFGNSVRIHHQISKYPEKIVFWSGTNPKPIPDAIIEMGFGRPSI
jgi:hypothetical protein